MQDAAPTARIVIDDYTPLSHKEVVGTPQRPQAGLWTTPSWVPLADRRRLAAYVVRAAYRGNGARLLIQPGKVDLDRGDRREYGDAALIEDRMVAGVLGDQSSIVVDGADDDLGDEPDLPEEPTEPGPDASDIDKRIYKIRKARYDAEASAAVDTWEAAWASRPGLQAAQDEWRAWAERRGFPALLLEAATDAVSLGDSVIVAWPEQADWPRLEVFEPGFYFPVLDDDSAEAYPTKVHLVWELNDAGQPDTAKPTHVRRITFELVEISTLRSTVGRNGPAWIDGNGDEVASAQLALNEAVDENGRVYRRLPWDLNADLTPIKVVGPLDDAGNPTMMDRRSYRTCLVSDGMWPLGVVRNDLADLDPAEAQWRTFDDGTVLNRLDLGCDFLPLVHLPATPSGKTHYGRSIIDVVAQVLDDLSQTDTDILDGARFLAGPVIALNGAKVVTTERVGAKETTREMPAELEVRPGIIYQLGPDGKMETLDLSAGIEKLMAVRTELIDRLLVNARIPAEVVGRIPSSKAVSGVAMALAFSPFSQIIGICRMAFDPKLRLLLKFSRRLAQLQRVVAPGPDAGARVAFGNFMPADQAAVLEMVAAALTAHAISLQTAVAMLVAAGFPIDDARAEVDRIVAEDTAAAKDVADALAGAPGEARIVADRLQVELDEASAAPVIPLPPKVPGA